MSYTVRQAAEDLLGYLNARQRTIPAPATEDDPIPQVLKALNAAKNELAVLGPGKSFNARRATALRAPLTVAVTGSWAQYATSVTIAAAASWMLGCTIRFGTEPYNEIVGISGTTVTLAHPMLEAGSGSGIVYHNCVTPDSDVLDIQRPVSIADEHELIPIYSPTDFASLGVSRDYGMFTGGFGSQGFGWEALRWFGGGDGGGEPLIASHPQCYFVERVWAGSSTPAAKRMRLAPMPDQASVLHYRVGLAPPEWVVTDIYADGNPDADPGTLIPLEDTRYTTTFLPYARMRFAAMPVMSDAKNREQIRLDYEMAYKAEARLKPFATGLQGNVSPAHW